MAVHQTTLTLRTRGQGTYEITDQVAEAVRASTMWGAGRPLSTALMFTPPDVLARVDAAVRAATA